MNGFRQLLDRVLSKGGNKASAAVPDDVPETVAQVWRRVKADNLTYLSDAKLASLVRLALDFERRQQPGLFIEAGCALGGSALILAAAKAVVRELRVYDVFEMIPPPTDEDGPDVHERYRVIQSGQSRGIRGEVYYGYQSNLFERVSNAFKEYGLPRDEHHVTLFKGLVQDTLSVDGPVCLAHVDVDWHDPVMCCLERIVPHLCEGGAIVLDDYGDWSGCRKAVDAYFERIGRDGFEFEDGAGHLVVRRR